MKRSNRLKMKHRRRESLFDRIMYKLMISVIIISVIIIISVVLYVMWDWINWNTWTTIEQ